MNNYELLNPMQKEAVFCTEGPLLILAGAGSGKTRVLTHRVAYLIDEKEVNPWNILAITFTNKAAGEMRERVDRQVEQGAGSVWVSTFHSTCVRILRRHIDFLGYETNFTIYDGDDQKTVIKQVYKQLQIDPRMYKEREVLNCISRAKDHLITPSDYMENASGDYWEETVARIYEAYQSWLKKNNALDFDDLIMKTVELFQSQSQVLDYYQERFRYIMVDEYQDTNRAQFELIRLLASRYRNLCVVGDDDQSIYKFRGADIRNILDFEEAFPGARVIKLEQNYRSSQTILDAANSVIRNNKGRKDKTLWTANGKGDGVRYRQFDQAYEEAEFIIKDVLAKNLPYQDCAVLYRTNAQSRLLEEQCVHYNVPYRLVGGVNFYQRKEIKDILSYLKTIANGRDDLAVSRIVNVPKRGIGATSIGKLTVFAAANDLSLYDAMTRAKIIPGLGKAADKIGKFTGLIEEFRARFQKEDYGLRQLVDDILEDTGYKAELEEAGDEESQGRLENIQELVNKAVAYWSDAQTPTLDGFLEEVALVADVDQLDPSESRVTLMTLHSAKGLEFKNVYLSGMEDGLFPSYMTLLSEDPGQLEEERRLCYVGITRAMERLTMTSARTRMVNGETRYCKTSRFIEEIPEELLDGGRTEPRSSVKAPKTGAGEASDLGGQGASPKSGGPAAQPGGFGRRRGVNGGFEPSANPYASQGSAYSSGGPGAGPGFGKAFTVAKAQTLDYQEGDRVKHVKFGAGTVRAIKDGPKDYEVTVEFDKAGVKKMFASFARLQKLEEGE